MSDIGGSVADAAPQLGSLQVLRVRELLEYDPDTGALKWRFDVGPRAKRGQLAGHLARTGYLTVRVDGRLYQAHRLIWFWVTGSWPINHIDHKDGDRANNRWANLRDVLNRANRENVHRARIDSGTGVQGVSRYKSSGRFVAKIRANDVIYYLGWAFPTKEAAQKVYLAAKSLLHAGWVPLDSVKGSIELRALLGVAKRGEAVRVDSVTGARGVQRYGERFRARHKGRHLGLFETIELAGAAYEAARKHD